MMTTKQQPLFYYYSQRDVQMDAAVMGSATDRLANWATRKSGLAPARMASLVSTVAFLSNQTAAITSTMTKVSDVVAVVN